jgi:outer membrane lipoprotein-sorting protein
MITSPRHLRSLVAVGLAIGLVAAACSSSSIPGGNGGNGVAGGNGGNGGSGGSSLASGLASNLDKLDSYQFSWQLTSNSSTASAADTGTFGTSGIVVNKPTPAYKINDLGMLQILVIGDQGWTSFDNGSTWTVSTDYTSTSDSLKSLLPTSLYGSDFDTNATQFSVKGDETKNGVDCIHYQGNTDLGAGGAILGVNANFKSDLWVAKNGNYPVSGFYGYSASSGGQSGSWGYSFDVTHVNDASANAITAPANVTP